MKQFANLVHILGTSTKTTDKLNALKEYFLTAGERDKVWVIALFSGRRPRRAVSGALLSQWCVEETGIPGWLFGESYHTVGDLAETISLLLSPVYPYQESTESLSFYIERFRELEKADDTAKRDFVVNSWKSMSPRQVFVFNKLITGSFRIGVSQKTIVNAIAATTELSASEIAHRISGKWDPSTISYNELLSKEGLSADHSKPYPFYLAYAVEENVDVLGDPSEWQAEWKWDGIRGQLIKRNNELFTWSRGEELISEKFPEYMVLADKLPDGIALDGEIIGIMAEGNAGFKPLPFSMLQTRIGRKNITKKHLQEVPAGFIAYDLLEYDHEDIREWPLIKRRELLKKVINNLGSKVIHVSPEIEFENWDHLAQIRRLSREKGSEGIMIKKKDSVYRSGRRRGDWWKWKIDPLTIDAVMIYAQKGSGRRSNLFTDYTFAVRDGDNLVAFTKAYSGLTDKEFAQVDAFVKRNSLEKFGPVRTVKPELVFEIAFEGIAASNRHKSGVALRFPRMSRWRKDKPVSEINTLEDLKAILENYNNQYDPTNEKKRE